MKKSLFMMMAMAVLFTSCFVNVDDLKTSTKQMDLKDFNKISVGGDVAINFTQDSIYSVAVTTTKEGFDNIDLQVKDGVLTLNKKDEADVMRFTAVEYELQITAPDLKEINIAGAGVFESDKINTSEFSAQINGAGVFDIKNLTAEKTAFAIFGAGHIEANLADCGDVDVQVSGAGSVELTGNARSLTKNTSGMAVVETDKLSLK